MIASTQREADREARRDVPRTELDGVLAGHDQKAESEGIGFAYGTLDDDARRKEHGRREAWRDHVAAAALILFWLVIALLSASMMIYAIHTLTPWQWLTDDQLDAIKGFLFSGSLVGFASTYAARNLGLQKGQ